MKEMMQVERDMGVAVRVLVVIAVVVLGLAAVSSAGLPDIDIAPTGSGGDAQDGRERRPFWRPFR